MKKGASFGRRSGYRVLATIVFAGCILLAGLSSPAVDFSTIRDFSGVTESNPRGGVIQGNDGRLYGTTQNSPVVFGTNLDGTGYSVLHTFAMGETPRFGVMQASDGKLYGVATDGSGGFLYRVDTNGSNFQVLVTFHTFLGGREPSAPPIEGSNGKLYGFLREDTTDGLGGVYEVDKDGSNYSVLFSFSGGMPPFDGAIDGESAGRLLEAADGFLYGVVPLGGQFGNGVIFRIEKDATDFLVLHHFEGFVDEDRKSGLIQGPGGRLYGVSSKGGSFGHGMIFRIEPDGTGYVVIHEFRDFDGRQPGELTVGADGRLYGVCFRGGGPLSNPSNFGVIFRILPNGAGHSVIHRFEEGDDGVQPDGPLLSVAANIFFGTTAFGDGLGTVFRIAAAQQSPTIHARKRKRVRGEKRRRVKIRGLAFDDIAVHRVIYRQRGGKFRIARGTESWRIRVRLKRKRTKVQVFAQDFDLNPSPLVRIRVFRK